MTAFSTHDLFRDANHPLIGASAWGWVWPGNCLTAQSVVFPYPSLVGLNIQHATWRLCWNPNVNNGSSSTAVRIVAAYDGPVISEEVTALYCANYTTPRNDPVVITEKLRAVLAKAVVDQKSVQIIHQTCGDGAVGPHIYSSALEIVYA